MWYTEKDRKAHVRALLLHGSFHTGTDLVCRTCMACVQFAYTSTSNKTAAHASKIPCGQPNHIHTSAEYDSINEHNASMYVRLKTDKYK